MHEEGKMTAPLIGIVAILGIFVFEQVAVPNVVLPGIVASMLGGIVTNFAVWDWLDDRARLEGP